jgi:trigger factor
LDEAARSIPSAIKREVRQRCGFGCVLCGYPIYDFHHEPPYREVKEHRKENIFCLCPKHHREAGTTPPLLPACEVVAAGDDPFCKRGGTNDPYRARFSGEEFEFRVGGLVFRCEGACEDMTVIMLAGEPILRIRFVDEKPVLSFQLFDVNDKRLLWVDNNELRFRADNWDVEWVSNRVIVRTGPNERIAAEIEFIPPNDVAIHRGVFRYHGRTLLVTPNGIEYPDMDSAVSGSGTFIVPVDRSVVLSFD